MTFYTESKNNHNNLYISPPPGGFLFSHQFPQTKNPHFHEDF